MTPERASALVARWVRCYTRALPSPTARRRIDEMDADLHDHIAHERTRGTTDRRIALSILSRMARGLIADASWRWRLRSGKGSLVRLFVAILAAALGVAAFLFGGADDSPGLQLIAVLLIGGAVALGVRAIQSRRRSA